MNHNLQLLQSLYLAASGKYRKYKTRLDKAVHTGRFYKLNKRKQSYLVSRLRRLYEKLKSLQTQLRIAGAGAALALTLAVSNPAQAQSTLGPFVKNDALNPLPPPIQIPHPRPAIADLDNDGDLDVIVGSVDGEIKFYRNDSPAGAVTRLTELTGTDNPLNGVDVGYGPAPALADVDKDGDFDLLIGISDGDTFFFRNTGTSTNPVFTQQTGSSNPFNGITGTHSAMYGNSEAIPTFVDFDEDSDIDLFIGSSYIYDIETGSHPAVEYYENNGSGVFSQTPATGLGGALEFRSKVTITFADINNDGGLDAIVGTDETSYVRCYIQGIEAQFNEQTGSWDPIAKTGNPFNGFYVYKYSAPIAADFDKDGDLDFLVGVQTNYYNDEPSLRYFENKDGNFSLEYKSQLNLSPFGGVDVGEEATPVFVDLDGDGDLDAVLGEKYNGNLNVFINNDGRLYPDPEHQLSEILYPLNQTYDVIPVFADIDNDGDSDMFASMDREIAFFRNNNGTFENEESPLDLSSTYNMSLAFIDVDNDGDLDALIGHFSYAGGYIDYRENVGTASVPDFDVTTEPPPFDVDTFDRNPTLFAVDIDHDGDTDLIVTDTYSTESSGYSYYYSSRTLYYENNGDGTFTESATPLLEEINPQSFTSYADIDGDGDLDSFIGIGSYQDDGKVSFYENTNPAPLTVTEMSDLTVIGGSPMILAPGLTITDEDNDDITYAVVTISDFVPGSEVLEFTPKAGISGVFDDETGVLTFIGKASIADYETLLRSVTINFTGTVPNARTSKAAKASSTLSLVQSVTFMVRDTDFTLTTVAVVSLNVLPGNELTIYNAVSPNKNDEWNSFFHIAAIETISPENTVTIYNRWGDAVFEVKNYNNSDPSKRFEGVNKNGKDLPTGTYFYKIEITGKTVTGYLSLKR